MFDKLKVIAELIIVPFFFMFGVSMLVGILLQWPL